MKDNAQTAPVAQSSSNEISDQRMIIPEQTTQICSTIISTSITSDVVIHTSKSHICQGTTTSTLTTTVSISSSPLRNDEQPSEFDDDDDDDDLSSVQSHRSRSHGMKRDSDQRVHDELDRDKDMRALDTILSESDEDDITEQDKQVMKAFGSDFPNPSSETNASFTQTCQTSTESIPIAISPTVASSNMMSSTSVPQPAHDVPVSDNLLLDEEPSRKKPRLDSPTRPGELPDPS